jgi:hypothetical protein
MPFVTEPDRQQSAKRRADLVIGRAQRLRIPCYFVKLGGRHTTDSEHILVLPRHWRTPRRRAVHAAGLFTVLPAMTRNVTW